MTESPSEQAPDTRERLLDNAERLFAKQGFAGTSVRQITDDAGANLGAVNYHFRSKQNLYAEVFARRAAFLRTPVLEAAREAAEVAANNPGLAFLILGRAFLAPHRDRAASLCLMELMAREVVDGCLPPRLLSQEYLLPTINVICSVVRQARPDLEEALVVACGHAFFAQIIHIVKSGAAGIPVDAKLDHAVRFTVAGVMHMDATALDAHAGSCSASNPDGECHGSN
jgi:TetR/AcrR family transcriptional regulator, regulator of cefoperazone and chloramphenicol sensitivity